MEFGGTMPKQIAVPFIAVSMIVAIASAAPSARATGRVPSPVALSSGAHAHSVDPCALL